MNSSLELFIAIRLVCCFGNRWRCTDLSITSRFPRMTATVTRLALYWLEHGWPKTVPSSAKQRSPTWNTVLSFTADLYHRLLLSLWPPQVVLYTVFHRLQTWVFKFLRALFYPDVTLVISSYFDSWKFTMQAKRVRLSYRCQQLRTNYIKYNYIKLYKIIII